MWPDAPHRVLASAITNAKALPGDTAGQATLAGAAVPIPRFAPMAPTRTTTGAVDAMALYAGQSVDAVRGVHPAATIVRQLTQGAEQLLRRVATDLFADPGPAGEDRRQTPSRQALKLPDTATRASGLPR